MDSPSRRKLLNDRMSSLGEATISCKDCPGVCCTSTSNSMQITPLEAWDMICYFKLKQKNHDELMELLEKNIQEFRLDRELMLPGKGELRRTYTCPFFAGKELGCTVSPHYKPVGCLGFNPVKDGIKAEDCVSDLDLLQEREDRWGKQEKDLNTKIRADWGIWWEKKPIPVALKECLPKWWGVTSLFDQA